MASNARFPKTVFISHSQDMASAAAIIAAHVERLNQSLPANETWGVYSWRTEERPWVADKSWQDQIGRTSAPNVKTICLLGERVGLPLANDVVVPSDLELPSWVRFPGESDCSGVPLTGVVFELVDALFGPRPKNEDRVLCFVKGDTALLNKPRTDALNRNFGFGHWRSKCIRRNVHAGPEVDDYNRQVRWLDALVEVMFRSGSHAWYAFGEDGATEESCNESLRKVIDEALPKFLGVPSARSGNPEPKGLHAYSAEDSDIFFGRDATIERCIHRLQKLAGSKICPRPLLLLTGRSGEGKSSVLRAGVVGRLRRKSYGGEYRFHAKELLALDLLGDEEPAVVLTRVFEDLLGCRLWDGEHQIDDFSREQQAAKLRTALVDAINRDRSDPRMSRVFLAIDQWDEVTLLADESPLLQQRLVNLLELLSALAETGMVWAILPIQSQHVDRLQKLCRKSIEQENLLPPGAEDLRKIIQSSFSTFRISAEEVKNVLEQVGDWIMQANPGPVLPLLSTLMVEMVKSSRRQRQNRPSHEGATRPSLASALELLGNRAWEEAGGEHDITLERSLRRLLRHVVTTQVSDEQTQALRNCSVTHPAIVASPQLVKALTLNRLLYQPDKQSVRLTHLAVVTDWQRARICYQAESKLQAVLAQLKPYRDRWEKGPRDPSALLGDAAILRDAIVLWQEWWQDSDRLPTDCIRASVLSAIADDSPEWWLLKGGGSLISAAIGTQDRELIDAVRNKLREESRGRLKKILNASGREPAHTPLMMACNRGDSECVTWLLKLGASPNVGRTGTRKPLGIAAANGHVKIIGLLLRHGAKPNWVKNDGWGALHYAAANGHPEVVARLVRARALTSLRSNSGWNPIHLAAANGQSASVAALLDAGAEIESANQDAMTALHLAASNGHSPLVHMLLARGASLLVRTIRNETPLTLAAARGRDQVVQQLIAAGAPVDVENADGWTPLHSAASDDTVEVASMLLANGAKSDAAKRKSLWSAAHVAAAAASDRVLRLLSEQGADLDLPDKKGQTPLHVASMNGNLSTTQLLLDLGANWQRRTKKDDTPLDLACNKGHYPVVNCLAQRLPPSIEVTGLLLRSAVTAGNFEEVRRLIDACGTSVAVAPPSGNLLLVAARSGFEDIVELLLERGADRAAVDEDGFTALGVAIVGGWKRVFDLILASGADPTIRDKGGLSLIHHAAKQCSSHFLDALLRSFKVDRSAVEALDGKFWTPLHHAAEAGNKDTIALLLQAGCDVNRVTFERHSALHLAAKAQSAEAIGSLLSAGATVHAQDNQSWTPLHRASVGADPLSVRVLLERGADPNDAGPGFTPLAIAMAFARTAVQTELRKFGADVTLGVSGAPRFLSDPDQCVHGVIGLTRFQFRDCNDYSRLLAAMREVDPPTSPSDWFENMCRVVSALGGRTEVLALRFGGMAHEKGKWC